MLTRKYLFPRVIEMNYQAGRRLGVNVYLIDGGAEFLLIDIGYLDTVEEIVELIRQMDFNLSTCKMVVATHADADHIQGLARARELLQAPRSPPIPRASSRSRPATGSSPTPPSRPRTSTIPMPPCKIDVKLNEGDVINGRRPQAEGLAHARPHRQAAQFQAGQPAVQRRQHLQGQLRRRHRRPSRLQHPQIPALARTHQTRRQRVPAAQPRPRLPPRHPHPAKGHRSAHAVSVHGRLRHLRHRLAVARRVGQGPPRGPIARRVVLVTPRGPDIECALKPGRRHRRPASGR